MCLLRCSRRVKLDRGLRSSCDGGSKSVTSEKKSQVTTTYQTEVVRVVDVLENDAAVAVENLRNYEIRVSARNPHICSKSA